MDVHVTSCEVQCSSIEVHVTSCEVQCSSIEVHVSSIEVHVASIELTRSSNEATTTSNEDSGDQEEAAGDVNEGGTGNCESERGSLGEVPDRDRRGSRSEEPSRHVHQANHTSSRIRRGDVEHGSEDVRLVDP